MNSVDRFSIQNLTNPNFDRALGAILISSALLACISVGLALHAYLNPSGYTITTISGFALSSEMLTWSSIFLISGGYLIIQMVRKNGLYRQLGSFVSHTLRQKIRNAIAAGAIEQIHDEEAKKRGSHPDNIVTFPSLNQQLSTQGHWFPQDDRASTSTVIIFSGHAQHRDHHHMNHWVGYYQGLGMNICLVDLRGFGLNQGLKCSDENGEADAYHDACAALDFVLQQNIDPNRILVHGYSQGGPIAASLASIYPPIQAVILDHTYAMAEDVMAKKIKWCPKSIFRIVNLAAHPLQKITYCDRSISTNGWNTANRIQHSSAHIFVIEGVEDKNMPSSKHLIGLKNGKSQSENYLLLSGNHFYQFSQQNEVKTLTTFLQNFYLIGVKN